MSLLLSINDSAVDFLSLERLEGGQDKEKGGVIWEKINGNQIIIKPGEEEQVKIIGCDQVFNFKLKGLKDGGYVVVPIVGTTYILSDFNPEASDTYLLVAGNDGKSMAQIFEDYNLSKIIPKTLLDQVLVSGKQDES